MIKIDRASEVCPQEILEMNDLLHRMVQLIGDESLVTARKVANILEKIGDCLHLISTFQNIKNINKEWKNILNQLLFYIIQSIICLIHWKLSVIYLSYNLKQFFVPD